MSLLLEYVAPDELDQILRYLNAAFKKYGVDVIFRKHFLDRVNDARNKEPFTHATFMAMVNKLLLDANIRKLRHMKPGQEGVMIYKSFNFVYTLDVVRGKVQLRFITAMSKDNFKSNSKADFILKLESFREFLKTYRGKGVI